MKTPVCVSIVTKSCSDLKQGCKMGMLRTGGVPNEIQKKMSKKRNAFFIFKCDVLAIALLEI